MSVLSWRRARWWRGGRRSHWNSLTWSSTVDPCLSMKTVSAIHLDRLEGVHHMSSAVPALDAWWSSVSKARKVLMRNFFSPFPQRSARREPASGTCRPSPRPRRRSTSTRSRARSSCSTTVCSCPGSTPGARGWTPPTTTPCPCGSVAPSWSRSTSRPQVHWGLLFSPFSRYATVGLDN